jgi:conserved oligomeric Golgi complex subunit 1
VSPGDTDFRAKAAVLDARIMNRWQKYTVSRVATDYWISWYTMSQRVTPGMLFVSEHARKLIFYIESPLSTCPSTALMRSLLSLSTSIQRLGTSRDPSRLGHAANDTLRLFVVELLREPEDQASGWRFHERQALWDLAFLRKLADLWANNGWAKTSGLLERKMEQIRRKVRNVL